MNAFKSNKNREKTVEVASRYNTLKSHIGKDKPFA